MSLHFWMSSLTHWGRVTHICVSKLTIIGSDNGLSPGRRRGHYLNQWWNIVNSNLRNKLQWNPRQNSFIFIQKMHLKLSVKGRLFSLGLNELNLEVDQRDHSVQGQGQQYSKYGYITHHGLFAHMRSTIILSWGTWSVGTFEIHVDVRQRQTKRIWVELCYFMSFTNMLSYLLINIMLFSKDRVTKLFTVKVIINNIAFIIKGNFADELNITSLGYAISICIFYDLCLYVKDIF